MRLVDFRTAGNIEQEVRDVASRFKKADGTHADLNQTKDIVELKNSIPYGSFNKYTGRLEFSNEEIRSFEASVSTLKGVTIYKMTEGVVDDRRMPQSATKIVKISKDEEGMPKIERITYQPEEPSCTLKYEIEDVPDPDEIEGLLADEGFEYLTKY